MSVRPRNGRTGRRSSAAAAVSSSRSAVVPMATMRLPAGRAALISARGRLRHLAPFGMQPVRARVVGAHRQEGAGADMQGDGGAPHPARLQRRPADR